MDWLTFIIIESQWSTSSRHAGFVKSITSITALLWRKNAAGPGRKRSWPVGQSQRKSLTGVSPAIIWMVLNSWPTSDWGYTEGSRKMFSAYLHIKLDFPTECSPQSVKWKARAETAWGLSQTTFRSARGWWQINCTSKRPGAAKLRNASWWPSTRPSKRSFRFIGPGALWSTLWFSCFCFFSSRSMSRTTAESGSVIWQQAPLSCWTWTTYSSRGSVLETATSISIAAMIFGNWGAKHLAVFVLKSRESHSMLAPLLETWCHMMSCGPRRLNEIACSVGKSSHWAENLSWKTSTGNKTHKSRIDAWQNLTQRWSVQVD